MKSSKSTKAKPAKEEECGIWLDTKELKEKKQQLSRPISRLVCFTQTKLNMPVTRQSVISSFFTHTHTDPNRSATHTRTGTTHTKTTHTGTRTTHTGTGTTHTGTGTTHTKTTHTGTGTTHTKTTHTGTGTTHTKTTHTGTGTTHTGTGTTHTKTTHTGTTHTGTGTTHTGTGTTHTGTRTTHTETTHTGNKRKHGMTSDSTRHTSEPALQNRDGDCEGSSDKDQQELRFFHLIRGEESEDEEPPGKRRHVAHYIHEYDQNVLNTQKYQNIEEKTGTQAGDHKATDKGRVLTSRPVNHEATDKGRVLTSRPVNQEATDKGRVLTSRPVNQIHGRSSAESKTKASAVRRMGKENNGNNGPGSPNNGNNGPGSPVKRQMVSSPAKCRLQEKHTLLSPEKCVSAGETLASLFTQDSEGVCVIAHRDQHLLEEHTHSSEDTSHGYSVCALVKEEEDEPEMLFTQDSEGNMVIKH